MKTSITIFLCFFSIIFQSGNILDDIKNSKSNVTSQEENNRLRQEINERNEELKIIRENDSLHAIKKEQSFSWDAASANPDNLAAQEEYGSREIESQQAEVRNPGQEGIGMDEVHRNWLGRQAESPLFIPILLLVGILIFLINKKK